MRSSMQTLERALNELLAEANTALAALEAISRAAPGVLRRATTLDASCVTFRISWFRGPYLEELDFSKFFFDDSGNIVSFQFDPVIASPAGMLAARLRRERERLATIPKLRPNKPNS